MCFFTFFLHTSPQRVVWFLLSCKCTFSNLQKSMSKLILSIYRKEFILSTCPIFLFMVNFTFFLTYTNLRTWDHHDTHATMYCWYDTNGVDEKLKIHIVSSRFLKKYDVYLCFFISHNLNMKRGFGSGKLCAIISKNSEHVFFFWIFGNQDLHLLNLSKIKLYALWSLFVILLSRYNILC